MLPPAYAERAVSWSATPLDLPEDADILAAMLTQPAAGSGPWQVALEPGDYLISAFSDVEVFEQTVTVLPEPPEQTFEVAVLELDASAPYSCADQVECAFADTETLLAFSLPQGWAAERPYRGDLGDGVMADNISAVFFEETQGEDAAVWFLNPLDWIEDEQGPCRRVSVGSLCTFDPSAAAEIGFAVIAPSLRRATAAGATAP